MRLNWPKVASLGQKFDTSAVFCFVSLFIAFLVIPFKTIILFCTFAPRCEKMNCHTHAQREDSDQPVKFIV